jgi:hypothetical protein
LDRTSERIRSATVQRVSVLEPAVCAWVLGVVDPGAAIAEVRGLREGGSPWMLRLIHGRVERSVVLRIGDPDDRAGLRTEAAGLRLAARNGIKVPALIAADVDGNPPLMLFEAVAGSSAIPRQRSVGGRPAEDVAYWDAVAALSTPPDMGWFAKAIADQGRRDLTPAHRSGPSIGHRTTSPVPIATVRGWS